MIIHEDLAKEQGFTRKCYIWRLRDEESEVTIHAHWDGLDYNIRGVKAKGGGLKPLLYQEWGANHRKTDELPCDESL